MVRRGDGDDEQAERKLRKDDPASMVGFAFRILNEQTPIALIAILALGFLGWLYMTTLSAMSRDLRDHVRETGWYQRQSCISLAQLAGTNEALCDSNHDDRR